MRTNHQQTEDSQTRISRSKSRNQVSIASKLKQKQSGWNDRFHLDHIPEYNYQNQPHSQYLKNKFRMPGRDGQGQGRKELSKYKRIHQPSLEKNKVSNKPNPAKNQEKMKESITNAFSQLKALWYEKSIPQCHMQAMTKLFNCQNNPMKIFQDIKHQYNEVTKQSSLIQKIQSSIQTRQNCLQKLNQLLNSFQSLQKPRLKKQFQQKISHLRILTIHCIQCIFHWKQSIEAQMPKYRPIQAKYVHNGILYTKKVKEDYLAIANSRWKELYKFQGKIDAFFLGYMSQGKKIMNISKNLIKRVRLCQIMLNEDQQQLSPKTPTLQKSHSKQRKAPQKLPRSPPKKPSDLLVKPLHPSQAPRDKSVPPRSKTPSVLPWTKVPVQYSSINEYALSLVAKSQFKDSFLGHFDIVKFQQITVFRFMENEDQVVLGVQKIGSQRKIAIFVLKSTFENVQITMKSLCEYLWEHDYCAQVKISLLHRKVDDNYTVDVELEKKIRAVGFRWVSIDNKDDCRQTIYAIKRPLDTIAHKTSRRTQTYPVVIEHLINFSLLQRKQKKYPSRCFAAVIDMIRFVQQTQKQQFQQLCRRDQFYHHLQCLKKIQSYYKSQEPPPQSSNFSYSGMKSFYLDSPQTAQKIFQSLQIPQKKSPPPPSIISILNTSYKFNHITIQDGKYTKFFPNKDNEIYIVQSQYPIYILQTDEELVNFFVIEVGEGFEAEAIEGIFTGMGEESSFIDQFWLPNFYKEKDYVDEVGMPSCEIVSTNYRNCLGSLTRKSKVRTKIIKPPFVFGMINKVLLEILQIPFFWTLIRKEDLV